MLSIQEVNFYNSLANRQLAGKINCPFSSDDIVVTRVNSEDQVYFECITCNSTFHPGIKVINIIKETIDKYKNQV
jgi:transposase-like protein